MEDGDNKRKNNTLLGVLKMKETLIAVIGTLNKISVSGEDDLDRLLGCIQTLKNEVRRIVAEEAKTDG